MNQFFCSVVVSVMVFFSFHLHAREVDVLTVDWPPYYAQELKDNGPLSVITREAFKAAGHTVKITFVPWKRALEEVRIGSADMVLGAYDTEERRRKFIYTEKIYEVKDFIVGLEENGVKTYNNLEDLKGYVFGVTRGYIHSKEFMEASFLIREEVSIDLLNLRKLFANRVHFVVMTTATFKENLEKISEAERKPYVYLSPPSSSNGVYNIFSRNVKDATQLVKDFNNGLKQIIENGKYDEIVLEFGI